MNRTEKLRETYPVGSRVKCIYTQRPLVIKEGDVLGLACEDRVLVEFCIGEDSHGEPIKNEASVHENRILSVVKVDNPTI